MSDSYHTLGVRAPFVETRERGIKCASPLGRRDIVVGALTSASEQRSHCAIPLLANPGETDCAVCHRTVSAAPSCGRLRLLRLERLCRRVASRPCYARAPEMIVPVPMAAEIVAESMPTAAIIV